MDETYPTRLARESVMLAQIAQKPMLTAPALPERLNVVVFGAIETGAGQDLAFITAENDETRLLMLCQDHLNALAQEDDYYTGLQLYRSVSYAYVASADDAGVIYVVKTVEVRP